MTGIPHRADVPIRGTLYTLCMMPRSRSGPGNESHQNKAGR